MAQSEAPFSRPPTLTCDRAFVGSPVNITLKDVPANALIWFTFEIIKNGQESEEIPDLFPPVLADMHGRAILSLPDASFFESETVQVTATVWPEQDQDNSFQLTLRFSVENPELHFPSYVPGVGGTISIFDEVEGRVISRIGNILGAPQKPVFSPDGKRAYIMHGGAQVAVYDNLSNQIIARQLIGEGLKAIAITPDGRSLLALTSDMNDSSSYSFSSGSLWIYDAYTLAFQSRSTIDSIPSAGEGNLIALSEDSTLAFIRQEGMYIGEYNLLTGQFHRFLVGGTEHFGGEVRDIAALGNGLLTLIKSPDHGTCLHVVNAQTHRSLCIPAGTDVERIRLYRSEGMQPLVVLHDAADDQEDIIWLVDLFAGQVFRTLSLPDGMLDFDIADSCEIGMILYPGQQPQEGVLRFLNLNVLDLYPQRIHVPLKGEAYVYLSRSKKINSGYVFSQQGPVISIDLDKMRSEGQIPIVGDVTGYAEELYR